MLRFPRHTVRIAALAGVLGLGCRENREIERRESAKATATAEQMASETTLTSASASPDDAAAHEEQARTEVVAAFRLEQADYRSRLQRALDALDKDLATRRRRGEGDVEDLRSARAALKADLEALDRCTEPDWAPLRTRVERDLARRPP